MRCFCCGLFQLSLFVRFVFICLFILFRIAWWPSVLTFRLWYFTLCNFNCCIIFPFGGWGRLWNSIVSIPDHCLFIFVVLFQNLQSFMWYIGQFPSINNQVTNYTAYFFSVSLLYAFLHHNLSQLMGLWYLSQRRPAVRTHEVWK